MGVSTCRVVLLPNQMKHKEKFTGCKVGTKLLQVLNSSCTPFFPIVFHVSFRTKKSLWQAIADAVNAEFGEAMTALQIENKWKSLERSYKRAKTKNSASGHSRVSCEHEE